MCWITATLNTQSSSMTRDQRLTWPKLEIARSATAKARLGNKNLILQRVAAAPSLTSGNIKIFQFSLSLSLSVVEPRYDPRGPWPPHFFFFEFLGM